MRTPEELREMARLRYERRKARLRGNPDLRAECNAKARERKRRKRAMERREDAKRLGAAALSRICGFTGKACAWALTCQWNEQERRLGRQGPGGFARIEACALAAERGFNTCRVCPEARRCGKAWRCFRAESLERQAAPGGGKREISRFEGGAASRTGKDTPEGRGANCNGFATGLRAGSGPSDKRRVTSDE